MMKLVISFAIVLITAAGIGAQQPSGSPPPAPPPSSTPAPQPAQNASANQRTSAIGRGFSNFPLNPVSESDRLSARVTRLQWIIAPLYKRPSSKATAELAPDPGIIQRYAGLLKGDDTGIVRLAPDIGCVYSERVVNVKEGCLKFSFPGAGNSYSFRAESYRLRHLADITYQNDKLRMTGIFMHGIAVDLGDVAIENVAITTPGMKFLSEFEPSTSPEDVIKVDNALASGIRSGNYVYSKEVDPSVDRTYAIRAIAYRGRVVRAAAGIRYNELEYDKRRDVIVVFRVVQLDDEGITLVWRKISDIEPPKIKMPKRDDEKDVDDGEAN